jgi:hypothetical protein
MQTLPNTGNAFWPSKVIRIELLIPQNSHPVCKAFAQSTQSEYGEIGGN